MSELIIHEIEYLTSSYKSAKTEKHSLDCSSFFIGNLKDIIEFKNISLVKIAAFELDGCAFIAVGGHGLKTIIERLAQGNNVMKWAINAKIREAD